MELSSLLLPIGLPDFEAQFGQNLQSIGNLADVHTDASGAGLPAWETADIVIVGIPEDRGGRSKPGAAEAPDRIRNYLYQLAAPLSTIKVADIGNLEPAEDLDETYDRLAQLTEVLLKAGKVMVLLGGTQDVVYGQYRGFEKLEGFIEYVTIDSSPDILDPAEGLHHHSFNNKILTHSPNYLGNFVNLASQSYFITEGERKALKSLNFENVRVGELNANIQVAEPYLRTAHLVSFDLGAIRHADAPGTTHPSPAGLSVEQACQLMRFAGMGYHTQAISFCELNPELDLRNMTAHLTSLLVWYFIEGYYNRLNDQPSADRSNLTKYTARLHGPIPEIVFFKSERTRRWWMEVPSPSAGVGPPKIALVPCARADYDTALNNEIPERWWVAHYRYQ